VTCKATARFLKELLGNSYPGASRTRRFIDVVEVHLRIKVPRVRGSA